MPILSAAPSDIANIQAPNPNLPPDILASGVGGDNDAQSAGSPSQLAAAPTGTTETPGGLLTETAPLSTTAPITLTSSTPIIATTTAAPNTTTSAHASTVSHGLPPSKLAVAIVVPIAFLAILIPILVFWFLNHRRKLQEQRHASQRSSNSREPMLQKLREPMIERQPSYKGPAPARPLRTPAGNRSPHRNVREPLPAQSRGSLGLFNFELSPTTPKTPKPTRTPDSERSPEVKFSVARALELRRSQPSIVQPHARTSDQRVMSNPSTSVPQRPGTRGSNRGSANSIIDPPPPYASPRPSEAVVARSHFAPLSRIGTRNLADRSPPQAAAQVHQVGLSEEPDRSTYASSDAVRDTDSYRQDQTRSSSPSLAWPSPPPTQGVAARKPVPSQATGITSHSTSPQDESHLHGPFEAYLPERMSDISDFSIDTSRWEDRPRQGSTVSSIRSVVSPVDSDAWTIQPHHHV